MKIKNLINFYNNMGFRYFKYRVQHEIEKKVGILKKRHPIYYNDNCHVSFKEFLKSLRQTSEMLSIENYSLSKSNALEEEVNKILAGQVQFFNSNWMDLGSNYDWVTNPLSGYRYSITKHWSEIPDFSNEAGDIKYVWEKSRFSWILKIIRYDQSMQKDHSEFIFSEIESWIDNNPINMGPNWRCSQEISLRIFNWFFALIFYCKSPFLTEGLWNKMYKVIFASLDHVYKHIDFSRIAVRNNHAITETLFLALSELMFPFIEETKLWAKAGRKWFHEEISYQLYEDGTFLQFSMNYHRVVIQLLTLGINFTELFGKPFDKVVYDRAYKSLSFLYDCNQDLNGFMPNYGSNDGALFFPWSLSDYRDFRPQLNSLHYLLTGDNIYSDDLIIEDNYLWGLKPISRYKYSPLKKSDGIKEFPIGGFVIIRDGKTFTFIRCGSHKDRPAQADNLHVDIWIDGVNVLRDSGTYKYNTDIDYVNYFTGTGSHNTVVVNEESQMKKGSRFIWFFWTQKVFSSINDFENTYEFIGKIKAYSFLNKSGKHLRRLVKIKGKNQWIVEDEILNLDSFSKKQYWHYNLLPNIQAHENTYSLPSKEERSFDSKYYGEIEEGKCLFFEFEKKIKTSIEY